MNTMLSVATINQYYGGSHTLREVTFAVKTGSLCVLLGRNGVGKTTLLKTLMGLVPVKSGSIHLAGQDITLMPSHQRVAHGIAYVPQGREIFPRLTVEENLLIGAASRPAPKKVADDILALFPVLAEMKHRMGGDLSGGQQQQLAIGRALMSRPKLLILDEPTEGIQPNIIQMIGQTLRNLVAQTGLTILLVEQYYAFAKDVADDYVVMSRGAVVAEGLASDMDKNKVEQLITL